MNEILKTFPLPPETIEFPRKKNFWFMSSILFKINNAICLLLGRKKTLKFLLNFNLVIWRLAYENSYKYYGKQFPNITYGVNEKLFLNFFPSRANVIDIGCGTGRLTLIASKFANHVTGIDYDPAAIKSAKLNNIAPNITYLCGNVNNLSSNSKYDVAIIVGVLEHLDSAHKYLINLHKIASRLIIEVPDVEADPLNLIRFNLSSRLYTDNDHVREYSFNSLIEQLKITNWKVIYSSRQGLMITIVADQIL
jgi:SAM-dependent methyltransferase